jgi:actin-related protein
VGTYEEELYGEEALAEYVANIYRGVVFPKFNQNEEQEVVFLLKAAATIPFTKKVPIYHVGNLGFPTIGIKWADVNSITNTFKMNHGFVVDLGNMQIRMYAILNNNVLDTVSLKYGGSDISLFLLQLLNQTKDLKEKAGTHYFQRKAVFFHLVSVRN